MLIISRARKIIKTENSVPVILISANAIFSGILNSCIMTAPKGGTIKVINPNIIKIKNIVTIIEFLSALVNVDCNIITFPRKKCGNS